jgi:hypothetical protein
VSSWEAAGKSDDWMTPRYVFDALGDTFDMDVAGNVAACVPAAECILPPLDGLTHTWRGFVWMNPPYGGRNALHPWLDRFFDHGNGICLVPDRTSAPWFQPFAARADAICFVRHKIKFLRPDGSVGASPGTGTALMAVGARGERAVRRCGLGVVVRPI